MLQGRNHCAERRLRGVARKRIHRAVDRIDARLGGGEDGGRGTACRVMGVKMDWQTNLGFQRLDERAGLGGFQQACHVFQPQHMRAGGFQILAHVDVILKVVFRAVRVKDVARVADRALANLAGFDDRIHRHAHVLNPVETVEHAEHIDAGIGRRGHEFLHHVVGVIGIAHPVGGAQQHLGHHIGQGRAQVAQALPRAFLQEAIGHIESRPAPAFDREELRQIGGIGGGHLDHIEAAHPRGQERLMRIAHGSVGDEQLTLLAHPLGHRLGALLFQEVTRAHLRLAAQRGRPRVTDMGGGQGVALGLWMAVYGDVGDIGQHLGRTVAALLELEQLGRLVDEFGGVFIAQKRRMFQQVLDEGDVGADPAHPELAQSAVHPGDGHLGRRRLGGDLGQQAVVIARDDPARVSSATVEADAHAGGRAVGGDAAIVGDKIVLRVFGGDAGLQGVAGEGDVLLPRLARRFGQRFSLGDEDLGADDVDAGDLFGDGMFDLHAGVYFDEVEIAGFHIHQAFDGARAFIVHMGADFAAQFADFGALLLAQIGGGGAFDDLLVAALDRAVALVQMVNVALFIAEDLHFDMAGAQDHLLQIALAIAESGFGLAAPFAHFLLQFLFGHDRSHPAPAATPRSFEHQRIADLGRLGADRVHVFAQHFGGGDDRHARLHRDAASRGFVPQGAHRLGPRSDEGDAVLLAGIDEFRVFRQQAIARVDGIGTRRLGHADHLVNAEIGRDGAEAFTDAIGLIRFETVQAQLVLLGVDRDRFLAHLIGGAHDADRDLTTVRDQDLFKIGHWLVSPAGFKGSLGMLRCSARGLWPSLSHFCKLSDQSGDRSKGGGRSRRFCAPSCPILAVRSRASTSIR